MLFKHKHDHDRDPNDGNTGRSSSETRAYGIGPTRITVRDQWNGFDIESSNTDDAQSTSRLYSYACTVQNNCDHSMKCIECVRTKITELDSNQMKYGHSERVSLLEAKAELEKAELMTEPINMRWFSCNGKH